jgi:hypothetical protein
MNASQQEGYKYRFIRALETPLPNPRIRADIALKDNTPIGWVNRHANDCFPVVWYIGIVICKDSLLNKGLVMQALGDWVNYLFQHYGTHKSKSTPGRPTPEYCMLQKN